MKKNSRLQRQALTAFLPAGMLVAVLAAVMFVSGPLAAAGHAPVALLIASAAGIATAYFSGTLSRRRHTLSSLMGDNFPINQLVVIFMVY